MTDEEIRALFEDFRTSLATKLSDFEDYGHAETPSRRSRCALGVATSPYRGALTDTQLAYPPWSRYAEIRCRSRKYALHRIPKLNTRVRFPPSVPYMQFRDFLKFANKLDFVKSHTFP